MEIKHRNRGLVAITLVMASIVSEPAFSQSLDFRWLPKNNFGANGYYKGSTPFENGAGAGFYVIGSDDHTDDLDNLASFSRYNKPGIMTAMNGDKTPTLPYSMTMTADANDPRRLNFNLVFTKNPQHLNVLDWPIDGLLKNFVYFRWEGAPALRRYDQITGGYTPPGQAGPNGVFIAPGAPRWGEMIGPELTVRVTMTSASRPISVGFVNAPLLGRGVRNVEFGCVGGFKKGESATFGGFIQVTRTNLPQSALTFQSETPNYHQVGRRDGDGWSVRAGERQAYMCYGPYTTDVVIGPRTATFRLMVDRVTGSNDRVASLDVYDANTAQILTSRDIYRRDFTMGANRYHDFVVPFTASGGKYEFRTYSRGLYLKQDYVRVQ